MKNELTQFIIDVINKYNLKMEGEFKTQVYPILYWDNSNETVILRKNKKEKIAAKVLHMYQDVDNLVSYSPVGVFAEAEYSDEESSSKIKPINDLWGVVLPCKYNEYDHVLIGTFNNDFNNTAHPNELLIRNGDSEVLITNELVSFKTNTLLVNGKSVFDFKEIDLSNYYSKKEVDAKLSHKNNELREGAGVRIERHEDYDIISTTGGGSIVVYVEDDTLFFKTDSTSIVYVEDDTLVINTK